ncbi:MAG: glycosyltransferase family 4 protein, partial [Bacteroidota bacterium]
LEAGHQVRVLSYKGVLSSSSDTQLSAHGRFQGIDYDFANGSPYRPKRFAKRNLAKLTGRWQEWRFLRSLKRAKKLDLIILSSMDLCSFLYYRVLTWLLRVPMMYQLVELNSAMTNRQDWGTKIKDRLLENRYLGSADALLPISQKLTQLCEDRFPATPHLRIPVVSDYQFFRQIHGLEAEPYFLYCGSSSYAEVVFFIVDAFRSLRFAERQHHKLYLVIGGDQAGQEQIQTYIEQAGLSEEVRMFSDLAYDNLVQYYKGAAALLIPLRPSPQDEARFPHKIGEYLASGRPLITTNVGEVSHYFTDQKDALIATHYEVPDYAEKMRFVIQNPQEASEIGQNGQSLGLANFDFHQYGPKLSDFFKSLTHFSH